MKLVGQLITNLSDVKSVAVEYSIDGIHRKVEVLPGSQLELPVRAVFKSMVYLDGTPAKIGLEGRYGEDESDD